MDKDLNTTSSDLDFSIESGDTGLEAVSEVLDSPTVFPEDVTLPSDIPEITEIESAGPNDVIPENGGDDISDEALAPEMLDVEPEYLYDDVPEDTDEALQGDSNSIETLDAEPVEIFNEIPEDIEADDTSASEAPDVEPDSFYDNVPEDAEEAPQENSNSSKILDSESEGDYAEIPEDVETGISNDNNIPEIVDTETAGIDHDILEDILSEEESPQNILGTLDEDDSHYHAIPNSEQDIGPAVEPYHAIPLPESTGPLGTDNIGLEETGSEEDIQNQFSDEGIDLTPPIAEDDETAGGPLVPDPDLASDSFTSEGQFSIKINEIIHNENLTKEQKEDILLDIRPQLLDAQAAEIDAVPSNIIDDGGPVLSLKRDESLLLDQGYRNIQDILNVRADDYRDQGYSEDDISTLLAQDKITLQEEFLRVAFPEQDVSPEVFNAFETESPTIDDNITDIQSMSDIEGWLGDINPNFDAFDPESPYCNNCGSCAYAVYQRLEGSTDSCASAENIGYNSQMNALTGMEQVSMSPEEIQERLLAEGDGAHAIIGIDRAEGPGHWFNAACIEGKVVAIDGQTGEITDWPPDYGDVVNWEMSIKKGA